VAFYRGAEACVLVYSITDPKSFENLNTWKSDFIAKAGPKYPEKFPFFVFGNKSDRAETDRKVNTQYVEQWLARNNNHPYEETSALNGNNIEAAFSRLARNLLK
jgi:Ras-related protein Rab-7A